MAVSLTRGSTRRVVWIVGGLTGALTILLVAAGVTSLAWGSTLRDEGRLLPGTTIAGVDVGDKTQDEARAEIATHLEPRLDHEVTVVHDEQRWTTTPHELGASSDAEEIIDEAFERTLEAGVGELTRMRWAGASIGPELDVALGLDDDAVATFVATIAEDVDRDPRDAEVVWTGDELDVDEGRRGFEVDTDATTESLTTALGAGEDDEVELALGVIDPEVPNAAAEDARDLLAPLVDEAMGHEVTLTHEGERWTTSPGEVAAVPQLEPAVASALAGEAPDEMELSLPEEAVAEVVANIAGEVDVAPQDAELAVNGSELDITPERDGLAVERSAVVDELSAALRGASGEVALTVSDATAAVTSDDFDHVLVLNQDDRQLLLFEDHEPAHEWPVAVGQGGSPTPTGTFTIGAKRFEPSWVNPSPDGWGSDMPARIGPGPDNPMGTRALNWNDEHGRDTLIRFHGTPNEDSIGEAASAGCVRMFNSDVEELYELIPSGTVVISQH